jgi:hypothetical protein
VNPNPRVLRHISISQSASSEPFTSPRRGDTIVPPYRKRRPHARSLATGYSQSIAIAQARRDSLPADLLVGEKGVYLEFDVVRDSSDALTGLEDKTHDIELLSVSAKDGDESSIATVFIPDESTRIIRKKIDQYATEETKSGAPKHQNLIARINSVRAASIKSIFTDTVASFPTEDKLTWWEVWIRKNRVSVFHALAEQLGIQISSKRVSFPERDILLAEARASQLQAAMYASDALAEVRLAKDRPSFFLRMGNIEQGAWSEEVAQRIVPPANDSPLVTILDTGIAQGHPLILPVMPSTSLYAYDQAWGVQDSHGHGTAMAGLALYGDLFEILSSNELVEVTHSIESVKILPPGAGNNQPELYGAITSYAVALPEIDAPERRRVYCLAVTSADKEYHGKPSSWSATIDQLCAAEDLHSRLIVCAAGNIRGEISRSTYLSQNDTAEIEDPAQSWNAITAGAYTENTVLIDDRFSGWTATAPMGDLCPTSRTSVAWDRQWPLKPDVVFEGGNLASQSDTGSASVVDDLSLITTNRSFNLRLFCRFGETSAASALASKLSAEIYSEYPNLRAETVRGLIIHVATWTPAMTARLGQGRKSDKALMLRRYGYGVPRIQDALRSARNDFTMIIEDIIQPQEWRVLDPFWGGFDCRLWSSAHAWVSRSSSSNCSGVYVGGANSPRSHSMTCSSMKLSG